MSACSIDQLDFDSQKATENKVQQCIAHLSSGEAVDALYPRCEEYVAAMAYLSPDAKHCTPMDFKDACESVRDNFSLELQREYCEGIVHANNNFWKKNHGSFNFSALK